MTDRQSALQSLRDLLTTQNLAVLATDMEGHPYTSLVGFWAAPDMKQILDNDIIYKEDNVVVDGNTITSRGPATALEFALKIVEKLCNKDESDKIKKATLAG